jgi:hypothetical protein
VTTLNFLESIRLHSHFPRWWAPVAGEVLPADPMTLGRSPLATDASLLLEQMFYSTR